MEPPTLRLPLRASGLLAAAAVAGAIVYWRASDRQRSRHPACEIDAGIAEGRQAAASMLEGKVAETQPFDQRA